MELQKARVLYFLSLAQPQVTRSKKWYLRAKRAFDFLFAMLALLLLSPLMLIIALAIKVTSPGPAILVQERVGKGGRIFPFYKFRSMYNNPDRSVDINFARDYINGKQGAIAWNGIFKPANDRRVTSVGRFLRKASLDELPQLFNVLKGDMSIIGPRPSMPYEVDVYKPWHFARLEILPGVTGLAQVNGRSNLLFKDIVKIDIEYIERCSLMLDLSILCKTIPVVLSGHGAR
ncbi:MAG: sugar transferase [Chloroflexi bacterium]|nr:sugar transferase [Chloroflexota bacterium]